MVSGTGALRKKMLCTLKQKLSFTTQFNVVSLVPFGNEAISGYILENTLCTKPLKTLSMGNDSEIAHSQKRGNKTIDTELKYCGN